VVFFWAFLLLLTSYLVMWLLQTSLFVLGFLLFIYLSTITFFVLVITEKKNSLARLVMWGRTLKVGVTIRKGAWCLGRVS